MSPLPQQIVYSFVIFYVTILFYLITNEREARSEFILRIRENPEYDPVSMGKNGYERLS